MTVAFVLSGGASLGAVEVGMLAALRDHGIRPDMIVGTSVGALNGGWLAGHPDNPIDDLADIWRALRRSRVFPANPVRGFLGFAGRRRGLVSEHALRRLLTDHLTFSQLEDAPIPLHVVAVNVLTGNDVVFSRGPACDAILASAAIPAIFDPVVIDGVPYMDGGVVNNTPISWAVELGADEVWVLCAGYACALTEPPKGALAMGLHALTLLIHQQLIADVERYEPVVKLKVIPPLCPMRVSPADFRHADDLIRRAFNEASAWITADHPAVGQAQYLGLHDHGSHG